MKTRRIEGTDITAALREVRRTLGADAVIMSTRETPEGIEIIAAAPPPAPRRRDQVPASARARAAAGTRVPARAPARRVVRPGLAALVSHMARPATGPALDAELDAAGFTADVRDGIVGAVAGTAPERALAAAGRALAAQIQVEGAALMHQGGRVAVLGGTGVGKTTTIAKLAAHFARRHGAEQVALVNADQYRIGASDQLRRFARLIGVPVADVRGAAELAAALKKLAGRKLVLVDTAGLGESDVRFAEQAGLLRGAGLDCYLALSLNTQAAVLARGVRAYSDLRLRGLVLTKEDEALSLGAGLSMALRHRLPVSFVTTGPNVPADIRLAKAGRLAERALALAVQARAAAPAAPVESVR